MNRIGFFNSWLDYDSFIFIELAIDDNAIIICLFGFGIIYVFKELDDNI